MSFLSWITSGFSGAQRPKSTAGLFDTLIDTSLMLLISLGAGYGAGKLGHNHVVNPKMQNQVRIMQTTLHSIADVHEPLSHSYKQSQIALLEANALAGAKRNAEALQKYNEAEAKLTEVKKAVEEARIAKNVGVFVKALEQHQADVPEGKEKEMMDRAVKVIQREAEFHSLTDNELERIKISKQALQNHN